MKNKQKIKLAFVVLVVFIFISVPEVKAEGILIVNSDYSLPADYTPSDLVIYHGIKISGEIYRPLKEMIESAQKEGIGLIITSGYRTYDYQKQLFDKEINTLVNSGLAYKDAVNTAKTIVAPPGTSEHQTGLAVDIFSRDYQKLEQGFADTKAGQWLKNHAPEYGFILRYPQGKETITGITYEPWHYRYVGREDAEKISQSDLCLEEYVKTYPNIYNVKVIYDGKTINTDVWTVNNTVFVPVRMFFENLGMSVEYIDGKIKINMSNTAVEINDNNGLVWKGDVAYIPIREAAKLAGLNVIWDQNQYTVILTFGQAN